MADVSSITDQIKSTGLDIKAYSNPYGTPSKGKWNIVGATWTDSTTKVKVVFFAETRAKETINGALTAIDQISDQGSRRHAVYEYPYLDGQKIKDLGRKGETYTFNVKFFGPNYQAKYKEFYNSVYKSGNVGVLQHPVLSAIRGTINARLQSFDPVHRAEETNSVTFRAVFVEDNSGQIDNPSTAAAASIETNLQKSLQKIVTSSAKISTLIASASGTLALTSSVKSALSSRNTSISGLATGLLGQLGSTFASTSNVLPSLSSAATVAGGASGISSGTVVTRSSVGTSQLASVPPVFQVGLDASTQSLVEANIDSFIAANQVTPQQAVYSANQVRSGITAAISEAETNLGNYAYDIVVEYRSLAVSLQETVESCIASAQTKIKIYTVPRPMSLRMIAKLNGLDPDRQNDIENLNPFLPSVNYIAAGSQITVPAA